MIYKWNCSQTNNHGICRCYCCFLRQRSGFVWAVCSFDDFCRGQKLDSELIWKPWPLAPSLLDKWSSTLRTLRSLGVGTCWSNLIFWGSKFTTGYEPCWFPRSCGDVSDESNIYRSVYSLCNYIYMYICFYSMSIQDRRECSCPLITCIQSLFIQHGIHLHPSAGGYLLQRCSEFHAFRIARLAGLGTANLPWTREEMARFIMLYPFIQSVFRPNSMWVGRSRHLKTWGNVQRLVLKMILLMERRFGFRANWGFWWFKLLVSQVGKVPWQNCLLGHVLFDDPIYNRQTADGRANRRIYWQFSHCRRAWTWLVT